MLYFISLAAGLITGSFANVCIYRLPRGESIVHPNSRCPHCGKPIRLRHNIPILSYLMLKGRCMDCGNRISPRYFFVELAMALLFLAAAWRFSDHLSQIVVFDLLAFYLLTISVIDFDHKIIPDELSLSLLGIGLIAAFRNP